MQTALCPRSQLICQNSEFSLFPANEQVPHFTSILEGGLEPCEASLTIHNMIEKRALFLAQCQATHFTHSGFTNSDFNLPFLSVEHIGRDLG